MANSTLFRTTVPRGGILERMASPNNSILVLQVRKRCRKDNVIILVSRDSEKSANGHKAGLADPAALELGQEWKPTIEFAWQKDPQLGTLLRFLLPPSVSLNNQVQKRNPDIMNTMAGFVQRYPYP